MNLYDILQVTPDAETDDIKKAYRTLALKYHPDKNKNQDATKKFIDIQMAYEILSDSNKRADYDRMNPQEKFAMYDNIKKYFYERYPQYKNIYDFIIGNIFGDEGKLKADIDSANFVNIYNTVVSKAANIFDQGQGQGQQERPSQKPSFDNQITISPKNKYEYNFVMINDELYCYCYVSLYDFFYGSAVNITYQDKTIKYNFPGYHQRTPLMEFEFENQKSYIYIDVKNINTDYVKQTIKSLDI